jgi:hypothetical protein
MSRMLAVALCGMMVAGVAGLAGCGQDHHMPWKKTSTTQPSMAAVHDDCQMCPGVQTARADGTCPKCGAKVKG